MVNLAEALRDMKAPPRKVAPQRGAFALRRLKRMAAWGAAAAAAVLITVAMGGTESASQRLAAIMHPSRTPAVPPAPPFDAQAETRRLSEALRSLASDNNQLKTRVAALEQTMEDMTGSINREVEAAKAAARDALDNGPTVQATAAATASQTVPLLPESASAATFPGETPQAAAQYGIDIGSALTLPALRARWLAIRSAHPQLLEGLQPVVNVKEIGHSSRIELRLVAGPLEQSATATHLCAALTAFGLYCQPTIYDGQHLALK